jgi:hypothetical protein
VARVPAGRTLYYDTTNHKIWKGGGLANTWAQWVEPLLVTSQLDVDGTLAANSDTAIASQKATKTYVDAKVAGLSWKQAVRAATTVAGTLASSFENGDTIDGVVLATGDRILIKNQASGAENGIYVVPASGAPARATDADAGAELVNATVYVSEGTTNADTQWTCTNNATPTLGSTSLAFAQMTTGGAGAVFCGAHVYRATNQSIPNSTDTAISWSNTRYDSDGFWSAGAPTRLTVPSGKAGKYRLATTVSFAANSTSPVVVNIRLNGTTVIAQNVCPASASSGVTVPAANDYILAVADFVETVVAQFTGAAKDANANPNASPSLAIQLLG